MIISYSTLLPIDKAHADAVDIGITIKPILVRLKVIQLDVIAIITKVSNDFNSVVTVFYFLYFFFDLLFFFFEICNHLFDVTDMVTETVYII